MSRSEIDSSIAIDPTFDEASLKLWMEQARLRGAASVAHTIHEIAQQGIPPDLRLVLWRQLPSLLSKTDHPSATLELFGRFLAKCRSPQAMVVLFERDQSALPALFEALTIGNVVAETLIDDPEAFELLRITNGQAVPTQALVDEIEAEVTSLREPRQVARSLRRYQKRETARIAFGLFARSLPVREALQQWSSLADAILQAALRVALRQTAEKLGRPLLFQGTEARCSLLAFQRLGAGTLGPESQLDVLLLAETRGRTENTRLISNAEFFERAAHTFLELFRAESSAAPIYQVRLIQYGAHPFERAFVDVDDAFRHYDLRGRTWERQMFVQARPVSPKDSLGASFLERLQPWVYRRYLSDADLAGLGANQRKLQRRLANESIHRSAAVDVTQASADVEKMILFLQLLHGQARPSLRVGNTWQALHRLTEHRLLPHAELAILEETYDKFRRLEARQVFVGTSSSVSDAEGRRDLAEAIEVIRRVIFVQLEEAFPDSQTVAEETDLILDPQPDPGWVNSLLLHHRFQSPQIAYRNLMDMAEEEVEILSTRRCRYYLSQIAPTLLRAIGLTPSPDQTLFNLARMSASLGGKGVLWELLAGSPATMQLIVRLCACSEYLVGLITQSPGMIDELIDSLLLDRLPRRDELEMLLAELCREANERETDSILDSFKGSMHLRVGVRDVLGKDSIIDTHRALSDIVEVCIQRIVEDEYQQLVAKHGQPRTHDRRAVPFAVIGLGKLGGQEPNYHSDFSVIVLFAEDGKTVFEKGGRNRETTTHRYFFEQLAQRLMRRCNRSGRTGKLFELDVRFGPLGKSGVLAMEITSFLEYFRGHAASTMERLSLCKARPLAGSPEFSREATEHIQKLLRDTPLRANEIASVKSYLDLVRTNASIQNIKRGEGGTVAVECLVGALQLRTAVTDSSVLVPGTLEAIRALERAAVLDAEKAKKLHDGYLVLREIESGIRLMNSSARHDLPDAGPTLDTLAFLLDWASGQSLRERVQEIRLFNRELVSRFLEEDSTT